MREWTTARSSGACVRCRSCAIPAFSRPFTRRTSRLSVQQKRPASITRDSLMPPEAATALLPCLFSKLASAMDTDREARVCTVFFWAWLGGRTLVWTLLTTLMLESVPLDVVELLYWGREWQWGYHKHPPLPAWLAGLGDLLVPN